MAVANLVWFPVVLTQPILLAVGAMRHAFLSSLIALPLSGLVLCVAARYGIETMAASQLVTTPFQMYVVLTFIRRHVRFTWAELALALQPSAVVSMYSIFPVLLIIGLTGFEFGLSLALSLLAGAASICGWVVGVRLTRHPIGTEIHNLTELLGRRTVAARLLDRVFLVGAD